VTPNRSPTRRAALAQIPLMSFFGPMFTAFQRWNFEFQQSKLSWCCAMTQKYFAPADF
jgi:hypothetical protein